jgi:hypothetical protein
MTVEGRPPIMRVSPVAKGFGYAPNAGIAKRPGSGFSGVDASPSRDRGAMVQLMLERVSASVYR